MQIKFPFGDFLHCISKDVIKVMKMPKQVATKLQALYLDLNR